MAVEHKEQMDHFENEIERAIQHVRHEYSIPYASLVGILMMKAHELAAEALKVADGDK